MVRYSLDDLGVPVKTGKNPRDGVEKGEKILKDFSDDCNPVSKHGKILKSQSSKAFAEFQKEYEWFDSHLKRIAKYAQKECGRDTIRLDTYFITLAHKCMQTDFSNENIILNCHYNGPNDFAYYFTSTVKNEVRDYRQRDLAKSYLKELWEHIPIWQLKNINWIAPKFISNYAYDSDPHLTVEIEFDLEGIQRDGGIYSDLFIQEAKKFPFFPFQPFFGGAKKETVVVILPPEDQFEIDVFVQKIADKIHIPTSEIQVGKKYNFEIAIENLKFSTNLQVIKKNRIENRSSKEISEKLISNFIQMSVQNMRGVQQCTASDYVKGKDDEAMAEGLTKRLIESYNNPAFMDLESAIFGPPQDLRPFDRNILVELDRDFQEYKRKEVGK